LKRNKSPGQKNEIVWGVRAPDLLKRRYLISAVVLGIPAKRLVVGVLERWHEENVGRIGNPSEKARLIAELNLTGGTGQEESPGEKIKTVRTQGSKKGGVRRYMNIRAMPEATGQKLKVMAFNRGISIAELITQLTEQEWKKGKEAGIAGLPDNRRGVA
jgi:hypothetical protein